MREMDQRKWLRVYFYTSVGLMVALAVFAFGVAVGAFRIFPYQVLETAAAAGRDWARYPWHNARVRPEKYLAPGPEAPAETVEPVGDAYRGVTFVDGFFEKSTGMRLLDMHGNVLHAWPVAFNEIWPDAAHVDGNLHDWDAQIHGAILYPNGDVVFNFQYAGLAKIDKCARPVWRLPQQTHHSVYEDATGNLWVPSRRRREEPIDELPSAPVPFWEDLVLEISPDGEVLREISVLDAILKSGHEGLLFANGQHQAVVNLPLDGDFTHLNDVEILEEPMSASFPQLSTGDILLSLRNLNLLLVLDAQTDAVKWWMVGPHLRQHDPDFLPNGKISVFDNRRDSMGGDAFGGSRIFQLDPVTRETSVVYGEAGDERFYTETMGDHQYLPNGNVLITESEKGRAFEVSPAGKTVWSFVNRWDDESVAMIGRAVRYPASYADFIQTEDCE